MLNLLIYPFPRFLGYPVSSIIDEKLINLAIWIVRINRELFKKFNEIDIYVSFIVILLNLLYIMRGITDAYDESKTTFSFLSKHSIRFLVIVMH